jgi:hypothetical protein
MPNEMAASQSMEPKKDRSIQTGPQIFAFWAALTLTLGNIAFLAINWINFDRQQKEWAIKLASLTPAFEFHYYAMPADGPTIGMLTESNVLEGHPLFQSALITDRDNKQYLIDTFGTRSFTDADLQAIDADLATKITEHGMEMVGEYWVIHFELVRGYTISDVRLEFSRYASAGSHTMQDDYAFVTEMETLPDEYEREAVDVKIGDISVGGSFYIPLSLQFKGAAANDPNQYVGFLCGHFGVPDRLHYTDPVTKEDVAVEIRSTLDSTIVTWVDVLGKG